MGRPLPAIDYGSVVESLRRSPAAGRATALASGPRQDVDESRHSKDAAGSQSMNGAAGGATRTPADTASLDVTLAPAATPSGQDSPATIGFPQRPTASQHAFGVGAHDVGSGLHRTGHVDIIPAALRPRCGNLCTHI
eukprot:XP_001701455.1 hypothetical protein CHLREDRAFT_205681 [Chlamydomonas reinhardtii]